MTDPHYTNLTHEVREEIVAQERESIVEWLESHPESLHYYIAPIDLERVAREIRDGAHRKGEE